LTPCKYLHFTVSPSSNDSENEFAGAEEIFPAPESAHATAAVISLAMKAKKKERLQLLLDLELFLLYSSIRMEKGEVCLL